MRVFVTGGTGFLGGKIVEQLVSAGHEVTMLARRPEEVEDLPAGVTLCPGDLLETASLARGLEGAEAVVHAAALVKRWARDRTLFDRINVEALSHLVDLSLERGVSRFLYCSSFIALGPTDLTTGDENSLHDGRPRNDYERTKLAADREARKRQEQGQPLIVLYPGVVYGPGRLTSGNLLAGAAVELLQGKLPGTIGPGDRRQCLAFVDDVARGFLLALEKASPGSRYVLGGENLTVRQALEIMAAAGGVKAPERVISYGLARWVGRLMRWQARWTGIEPKLTDEEVEIYKHEWAFSSERARRELGYRITPADEGLRRMVRWLIESGAAPAGRGRGG